MIVSDGINDTDSKTIDNDNLTDNSVFKLVKIDMNGKNRRRPLLKSELDVVSQSKSESELEFDSDSDS